MLLFSFSDQCVNGTSKPSVHGRTQALWAAARYCSRGQDLTESESFASLLSCILCPDVRRTLTDPVDPVSGSEESSCY